MTMVLDCNQGRPVPDGLLLQHIKPSLDHVNQLLLEHQQKRNPGLTFTTFWSHLASLYDKDSQGQLRLAWEAVKLPLGELTLEKWHSFLREFNLKRDRLEKRTPHEEYTLLMKSLPIEWQRKVLTEEAKNAKGKWLVRLMLARCDAP